METPDRAAYARRNKGWLIPAFAAVLVFGLVRGNWFAVAGGALGLAWVGRAVWTGR